VSLDICGAFDIGGMDYFLQHLWSVLFNMFISV